MLSLAALPQPFSLNANASLQNLAAGGVALCAVQDCEQLSDASFSEVLHLLITC